MQIRRSWIRRSVGDRRQSVRRISGAIQRRGRGVAERELVFLGVTENRQDTVVARNQDVAAVESKRKEIESLKRGQRRDVGEIVVIVAMADFKKVFATLIAVDWPTGLAKAEREATIRARSKNNSFFVV